MSLIDHFERRLGTISGGKRLKIDGVQIAHYENGRFRAVASWSTLGMSRHVLTVRGTTDRYVLEVFLAMREFSNLGTADVGRCVEWVAGEMIGRHEARIRGDVQKLPSPIHPESLLDHVYFANPVYYDEDFYSVELEPNGQAAGIVWLIPIGPHEAEYVREHGWRRFEEQLERVDPDLFDLTRDEIF
ncbi:suppressor of fused domain protein [Promicromonospora sp. NPDC090134]|uniref:suppressor of fused domain protein n=1 Tax=Promicromonospora sp. NPDC090134 TaxID=3364408 RepID=UPI00382EA6C4